MDGFCQLEVSTQESREGGGSCCCRFGESWTIWESPSAHIKAQAASLIQPSDLHSHRLPWFPVPTAAVSFWPLLPQTGLLLSPCSPPVPWGYHSDPFPTPPPLHWTTCPSSHTLFPAPTRHRGQHSAVTVTHWMAKCGTRRFNSAFLSLLSVSLCVMTVRDARAVGAACYGSIY